MTEIEYVERAVNGRSVWLPSAAAPTPPPGPVAAPQNEALTPPSSTPSSSSAPRFRWGRRPEPSSGPGAASPPPQTGGLVVSVGAPGRQFSTATGLEQAPAPQPAPHGSVESRVTVTAVSAAPARETAEPASQQSTAREPGRIRKEKEELPEGVLAKITPGMAAAIALAASVAMVEAAYNLGAAVFTILHLPLPLAIGFPVIFELTAATFALQDLKDRRQGHSNTQMRVATYLTLITSAAVNAVVGYLGHGWAGTVELLPPLILAGVIHLHGDRATEAYHSQAVLRPKWRQAQLEAAQRESVLEVLPLLTGDDADGRATVALLRRRLESHTLEPGPALIAAGWHQRHDRVKWTGHAESRLRRLETVAATVWGEEGPPPDTTNTTNPDRPSPPPGPPAGPAHGSPTGSGAGSSATASSRPASSTNGSTRGSSAGSSAGSSTGSSTGSSSRTTGTPSGSTGGSTGSTASARTVQELRARTFEDLVDELRAAVEAGRLTPASSARAIRDELKVNAGRADALHAQLPQIAATPPHPKALEASAQSPASDATAGGGH